MVTFVKVHVNSDPLTTLPLAMVVAKAPGYTCIIIVFCENCYLANFSMLNMSVHCHGNRLCLGLIVMGIVAQLIPGRHTNKIIQLAHTHNE